MATKDAAFRLRALVVASGALGQLGVGGCGLKRPSWLGVVALPARSNG